MKSPLLATAFLLCAGALAFAQTVELKPQWLVGKRYTQATEMQQETTIPLGEQAMNQKVGTTMEITTTVTKHEDPKKKRLVQRYDRMVMDMDMMGQKLHFDSSDPASGNDPMSLGKALGAIVGKELRLVIDENNKVVEFENMDEVTAPFAQGNPMVGQMMKGMMNKETISQALNQASLKALPGKAVKAGDTWPYAITMNLPQLGAISLKGTYTDKGMSQRGGANCVELTETGTLDMDLGGAGAGADAGSPAAAMQQMGLKVEGGTIAGTTWFDPALGMTRETQFTQKMTLKMKNPTNPDASMEVPMTQTISIKLTGVTDAK